MLKRCGRVGLWTFAALGLPAWVGAQDLADLDYEHLSFRGFGLDAGYLWPTRIEGTYTLGARFDLGYAGPGLRIVPNVTYWSSAFDDTEITDLEDRIEDLIAQQGGGTVALDLGEVEWRDIAVGVDAHIVWNTFLGFLTYGGLGVTGHFLDGKGAAIDGTFVDDLLDSVTAGFNLHLGAEYLVNDRWRVYGMGKYEVLTDLQYFHLRMGLQVMTGANAPGER